MSKKPSPIGTIVSPRKRRHASTVDPTSDAETTRKALDWLESITAAQEKELAALRTSTASQDEVDALAAERDELRATASSLETERNQARAALATTESEAMAHLDKIETLEQALEAEKQTVKDLRERIADLGAEVELLRADAKRSDRARSQVSARGAKAPVGPEPRLEALPEATRPASSAAAETPAAAAPPDAMEDPVARSFVAWCRKGGGLVGRVDQFRAHLVGEVPGAEVERTARDVDSPVRPLRLQPGGVSPVEYWVVSVDGRHAFVPQPIGAGQFRELAPCFEGQATPSTLRAFTPATLRPAGAGYEVVSPGRVG